MQSAARVVEAAVSSALIDPELATVMARNGAGYESYVFPDGW